jgi:UDP-galactopyranose mutase
MFDDVVCFSHLRWGFVYQRPNHLMSRFARDHRVFFIEEPHYDACTPRLDVERHDGGLHVVVPHLPPATPLDVAERMQRELVDGMRERARIVRPLVWLYTPAAVTLVGHFEKSGCVYDCMDELSLFRGAPTHLVRREHDLFGMVDVVFTGGQSLYEAKRRRHRNVFAFPSSVDFAHFAKARAPMPDPSDQASIPHPRVGFFGVIDERLDADLVDTLARERPDWNLVFIGPVVKISPASLPERRNIHWLGRKSYSELPAYIAGWDVAFMPFARNDATRFISPTKTLEYLAAARPVVSTSIRDIVRPYGEQDLVRIADGPSAFATAIDAALADRETAAAAERGRARDSMLASTSWDRTYRRMVALVLQALSQRGAAIEEAAAPCSIT